MSNSTEKPIYLTLQGKDKLEAELLFLKQVKQPDLAERLHDASDGGDTIDNTEFLTLLDELSILNGRIQEIEEILRHSLLIEAPKGEKVQIGSKVTIIDEEGFQETFILVGKQEADPVNGFISNESPIGQALINKTAREKIAFSAPDGLIQYEILAIQ